VEWFFLKIVFFKSGRKRGNSNFFEKFLFTAFLISFLLLVAVQITLSSPALRPFVSVDGRYEGVPMKTEEYLYDAGEVTLELVKPKSETNIGILLNGELAAGFSEPQITLEVLDGDVIEIDASNAKGEVEVRISGVSSNISKKYVGKSLVVRNSIKILSQIMF
jgi:hypothetical protein